MEENRAVDVISVCHANGEIHPLRLQMLDDTQQLLRLHITDARRIQQIECVGAEAVVFQCRARVYGQDLQFRLKFTYRSHTWHLL